MPRNYTRKSEQGITKPDEMLRAVRRIKSTGESIRKTTESFGINYKTLSRYIKKFSEKEIQEDSFPTTTVGYTRNRQVFTDAREIIIVEYLLKASDIYFGLSPKECQKLANRFAKANRIEIPKSWYDKQQIGLDWLTSFLKRHRQLSLRTPKSTSLARASSFNRNNVNSFFQNLKLVLNRHNFQPLTIWNMDEIGITTVRKPDRIIGTHGTKQIGAITSAEQGTLITAVGTISASENSIPFYLIFS